MNSQRASLLIVLAAAMFGGSSACGTYVPPTAAAKDTTKTSNTSALLHAGIYALQLSQNPDAYPPAYEFPTCAGSFRFNSAVVLDSLVFSFNSIGQWQGAAISPAGGTGAITFSALSGAQAADGTYQITVRFAGTFSDLMSTDPCDAIAHDVRWSLPAPVVLLGTVSGDGRSVTGVLQIATSISMQSSIMLLVAPALTLRWTLTMAAP